MVALLVLFTLLVLAVLLDVFHLLLLAVVAAVGVLLQHGLGNLALTRSLVCHFMDTVRCGVLMTPLHNQPGIGLSAEC